MTFLPAAYTILKAVGQPLHPIGPIPGLDPSQRDSCPASCGVI